MKTSYQYQSINFLVKVLKTFQEGMLDNPVAIQAIKKILDNIPGGQSLLTEIVDALAKSDDNRSLFKRFLNDSSEEELTIFIYGQMNLDEGYLP